MLDDLRNSASRSYEEDQSQSPHPREALRVKLVEPEPFLGMTAPQRFVVALMIFLMVSVLGALLLVVTDKLFIF
jgi:hypothetical protein